MSDSMPFFIENTVEEGSYAKYTIVQLGKGYGTPLANALRRVLLSSLPGAAVTSIQIEGVQHEFQTIPEVLEDVVDIVLHIKKLRVRSFSDGPVPMRLEVSGEREVTAADIIAPGTVEIANPELHIATLDNKNARLAMELIVETGRGFVRATPKGDQPRGVIPVDAIYSPVQKVNFTVTQRTDFDEIDLEITTDGTITPLDALRQSAEILVRHFELLAAYHQEPQQESTLLSNLPIPQKIYDAPIEELDLSVRAYNSLKRSNITLVGQILSMNDEELLGVRNFGEKSLMELCDRLLARDFLPNLSKNSLEYALSLGNDDDLS